MPTRLVLVLLSTAAWLVPPAAAQDAVAHHPLRETRTRTLVYQERNRGPEQTERFSRKIKMSRNGSVMVTNISGEIVVTGGSGDEVSIEAVKRTRGDRGELGSVRIEVSDTPSRVDVRTNYPSQSNNHVWVEYTITIPASASLELHSISGSLKVTGVQGPVRADTVSGSITTQATPRLEHVKSVSGAIDLTDAGGDGDTNAGTISGTIRAKGLKCRGLDASTVSGSVILTDVTCDRVGTRSVSGSVEYSGALSKGGRYNLTSHSGSVRLALSDTVGFELDATTFSGSIQSDLPLTIGGSADRNGRRRGISNRSLHAVFGDGSAVLTVRTLSGSITISKR